jgi:hypothetical protein
MCGHPWHRAGVVQDSQCQFSDTVPPIPVSPPCRAPRKRTVEPSKRVRRLPRARSGRRRDVGPVECVTSVTSGPVRPSPPLCHHPRHYSAIPGTVEARDDETQPRPLLCILWSSVSRALELAYKWRPNVKLPRCYPRSGSWTGTGRATTPVGSKIRQDNHQFRDTVRHAAICSA